VKGWSERLTVAYLDCIYQPDTIYDTWWRLIHDICINLIQYMIHDEGCYMTVAYLDLYRSGDSPWFRNCFLKSIFRLIRQKMCDCKEKEVGNLLRYRRSYLSKVRLRFSGQQPFSPIKRLRVRNLIGSTRKKDKNWK